MKFVSKVKLFSLISILLISVMCGCGGDHNSSSQKPGNVSQNQTQAFPIVVEAPSKSAHYKYKAVDMTTGQPFSPKHAPKSTSRRPGHTREAAGGVLYAEHTDGKLYVLLGKESGGAQAGTWNFMTGNVETGETYLRAAKKEIFEESGGVYQVSEEVLEKNSYDVFYNLNARNNGVTFFVKVPYVSADEIFAHSRTHKDRHFQEMSAYEWILLDDLKTALQAGNNTVSFQAATITGQSVTIQLYNYSFNRLEQTLTKGILDHL